MKQEVIRFSCQHCSKEIRVQAHAAGKIGTCPRCNSTIAVPDNSGVLIEPLFSEDNTICDDSKIKEAIDHVVAALGHRILNKAVHDSTSISLDLAILDGRSQTVSIGSSSTDAGNYLGVASIVGTIENFESAYHALLMTTKVTLIKAQLTEDNQLTLLGLFDASASKDFLATQILLMATVADTLEEKLFGWDRT